MALQPPHLDKTWLVESLLFSDEPNFDAFENTTFEDGSYFEMDEVLFADGIVVPPTFQIVETRVYCDLRHVREWLSFIAQFEFCPYRDAARAALVKKYDDVWNKDFQNMAL